MIKVSFVSRLAVLLLGWLNCVSCTATSPDSDALVTNGKVTSAYPAVVMLDIKSGEKETFCSGTFLSDAVVLTAAHCFFAAELDEVKIGSIRAESYVRHPKFTYHIPALANLDGTAFDLALVKFPKRTSKDFMPLAKKAESTGAQVIVVGFGGSNVERGDSHPAKREGRALVTDRRIDRYYIEGSDGIDRNDEIRARHPHGIYASIAEGDSGGPMISSDGRAILGVTSYMSYSTESEGLALGVFNDVLGRESQDFLKEYLPKLGR